MITAIILALLLGAGSYDRLTPEVLCDTLSGATVQKIVPTGPCWGFTLYNSGATYACLLSIDGTSYNLTVQPYGDTAGLFYCPYPFMGSAPFDTLYVKGGAGANSIISVVAWTDQ